MSNLLSIITTLQSRWIGNVYETASVSLSPWRSMTISRPASGCVWSLLTLIWPLTQPSMPGCSAKEVEERATREAYVRQPGPAEDVCLDPAAWDPLPKRSRRSGRNR